MLPFDPYADPYGIFAGLPGHLADKLLHTLGGLLAHLLRDMTVYVQGEAGGGVAQVALHRFDVVAALNGGNRVAVPLWHNKDKSGIPCVATGFGFIFILFPSIYPAKIGITRNAKK